MSEEPKRDRTGIEEAGVTGVTMGTAVEGGTNKMREMASRKKGHALGGGGDKENFLPSWFSRWFYLRGDDAKRYSNVTNNHQHVHLERVEHRNLVRGIVPNRVDTNGIRQAVK